MEFLELRIAHDEPVVGIPQHEGLGHGFDGVAEAHVGRGGALGERLLFGDVDGDADEMGGRSRPLADEFGARAQPHPFAADVLHAERVIDRVGFRCGQHLGDGGEIAILRMHQRIDVAEGEEIAGRGQSEDLIHRIRPVDPPARQVPVPKPASAAAERGVDALAHALAGSVSVPRAGRLPEIGDGESDEDDGR